jgi:hypothetical protein
MKENSREELESNIQVCFHTPKIINKKNFLQCKAYKETFASAITPQK